MLEPVIEQRESTCTRPAPKLALVLPCYNEEAVLPETARRLKEKLDELKEQGLIAENSRVVFVNDGSRDRTWELIRELHEKDALFQGIDLAPGGLFQCLQAAVRHGEGIVAEFQFAALLPDLVHGEVHDPAELVLLPVHVAGAQSPQLRAEYAGGLLGHGLLSGGKAHEAARFQAQGRDDLLFDRLEELGDAAHDRGCARAGATAHTGGDKDHT